jgi:hypothetical protein
VTTRSRPRAALLALLAIWAAAPVAAAEGAGETDPWEPLRFLVGRWSGEGAGFGGPSEVTHDWRFVLDGRFLELRTRSTSPRDDGTSEVHEDVGYVSRDTDRDRFVFRQFLSEGFVNTYDLELRDGDPARILFAFRESESGGGMKAQLRLARSGDDGYEMVLDLARPGGEFSACQTMNLKRLP